MSTRTVRPPARVLRCLYIMKQGSKTITSSPGSTTQQSASKSAPEVPAVIRTWRSAWLKLAVDGRLDLVAQLGDALGDRVGVSTRLDRLDRRVLDGLGDVEIRQADREVDRVFHALGHVERLADARGVDLLHPAGDPGVVHGELGFVVSGSVGDQAEDLAGLELGAPAQERKLDQERAGDDRRARRSDQVAAGAHRAAGGQDVVDQEHALAGPERVAVDLELVAAVLELILLSDGGVRELARLANRHEARH